MNNNTKENNQSKYISMYLSRQSWNLVKHMKNQTKKYKKHYVFSL